MRRPINDSQEIKDGENDGDNDSQEIKDGENDGDNDSQVKDLTKQLQTIFGIQSEELFKNQQEQ